MSLLPINCYNNYTIFREIQPLTYVNNSYKEVSRRYRTLKSKNNIYLMRTTNSSNFNNKGVEIGDTIKLKSTADNVRFTGDNDETYFLLEFGLVKYYIIYNQEKIEVCDLDLLYIDPNKETQNVSGYISEKSRSIFEIGVRIVNNSNDNNVQTTTWSAQLNIDYVYVEDIDKSARMINAKEWSVIDKEQLLFLSDIEKVKYLTENHNKGNINDEDFITGIKKITSI